MDFELSRPDLEVKDLGSEDLKKGFKRGSEEGALNPSIEAEGLNASLKLSANSPLEAGIQNHSIQGSNSQLKADSSDRLQIKAQVEVIKNQIGSLELVRARLGFSQRKMCQLLLMDSSCWSRWVKHPETVPANVWRSLQWYLALEDKIPGLNPQIFMFQQSRQFFDDQSAQKLRESDSSLQKQLEITALELQKNSARLVSNSEEIRRLKIFVYIFGFTTLCFGFVLFSRLSA